ncbi:ubiquinol-cytochrome-c reductase complex assembly factor 1-like isoform X1 [Ptychodera flava]|uniref:ubiquinol-cytochrome-c reductase complex assembly factor 1-like isoform X1 n=1 Tax=Ptychodera flava TaxID=63121 RepID=UPI003969CA2E
MSTLTSSLRLVAISSVRTFSKHSSSSCGNKILKLHQPLAATRCLCTTSVMSTQPMHSVKWISTTPIKQTPKRQLKLEKPSLMSRLKDGMGISSMKYNRFRLRISGKNLYVSCVEGIDIETFFRVCNLPDTFYSWFLVTQLHVWMCMVRLKREGREGKYITHYLVISMWHDIQERGRVLGVNSIKMKEALRQMLGQFQGVLFAYDEGLLSSDRVLAASLWRNLFAKQCKDPQHLVNMVEYVRQQIQYLDTLDSNQLIQRGRVKWLPFTGEIPQVDEIPNFEGDRPLQDPLAMPGDIDRVPGV